MVVLTKIWGNNRRDQWVIGPGQTSTRDPDQPGQTPGRPTKTGLGRSPRCKEAETRSVMVLCMGVSLFARDSCTSNGGESVYESLHKVNIKYKYLIRKHNIVKLKFN